jgi:hypothetical protein
MVHEAGHAVVARTLGADLVFVEVYVGRPNPDDGMMGGGKTCLRKPLTDNINSLAVCVAGYKAELAYAADEQRRSKMLDRKGRLSGDYKVMQTLLLCWPEDERLAAITEGFMLADDKLKANADVVLRIADVLFARRFNGEARIDGDELAALLCGCR